MIKHALFVRLEARPGKEDDVAAFLQAGLQMSQDEATTPIWFALRFAPGSFAVFDAFENQQGVDNHLNGPIAKALMAKADELFSRPPAIERVEVLGLKNVATP
jgi:quinol monooxygenase YgiN